MLEVKNVKTFQGMEGYGYNAALYLNGKRVAFVIDEGCGGTPHFQWEGKDRAGKDANEKAVQAFIEAIPPEKCPEDAEDWEKTLYDKSGYRKLDLEDVVGRMVDDYENTRRLARQKKTSVPFTHPGVEKGNYLLIKHNGRVEETKAAILRKHPDATFL